LGNFPIFSSKLPSIIAAIATAIMAYYSGKMIRQLRIEKLRNSVIKVIACFIDPILKGCNYTRELIEDLKNNWIINRLSDLTLNNLS